MTNVGIYKITSPTGKVYIGQSINIKDRFRHYREINGAVRKQAKLHSSLLKYGFNNHITEIVHELPIDVSQEILNTYEIYYMQLYKDCGVELLNIKEGGLSGRHSEETKQKQRLNGKLGKPVSEETRAKMRMVSKGKPSPMHGKKHTEEALIKMREYQRNRPFTPKGHPISEEDKIKMREARNKVPHPFLGKHHSRESKDKVSQTKKGCKGTRNKKVVCSLTGTIYDSAKEAAEAIGIKHGTMVARLNGGNKNRSTLKYL